MLEAKTTVISTRVPNELADAVFNLARSFSPGPPVRGSRDTTVADVIYVALLLALRSNRQDLQPLFAELEETKRVFTVNSRHARVNSGAQ